MVIRSQESNEKKFAREICLDLGIGYTGDPFTIVNDHLTAKNCIY